MTKWLALISAIALEVTGSLSLKGALGAPWLYALVVVGYLGAFVMLFISLRAGMALGVGYGIWGATGVALTALMSMVIYGEPISMVMALGIAIVMAGVLLVELGSGAATRTETQTAQTTTDEATR